MLGEKSKSVSFSRVYVCVKAKLTLVIFFIFFYAPFPETVFGASVLKPKQIKNCSEEKIG